MSSIKLAALATVLATLVAQGTASARGFSPTANDLRSNSAITRLRASGSVNDPAVASVGRPSGTVMFGSKVLGRDPDPNVRFDILRDRDIGRF